MDASMYWLWFWNAYFGGQAVWAVEPAHAGHADDLAAIHAASFARGWSLDEMEQLLNDRTVVACALYREGRERPVGFAASRIASGEAEVLSIAVIERRRGSGGGHALLARHLGRLAGEGVRRVVLEVDEVNAPALALYARFGFEAVGRRPAYYARADGSRGAAKVLALEMG